jgi:hypothetical protein
MLSNCLDIWLSFACFEKRKLFFIVSRFSQRNAYCCPNSSISRFRRGIANSEAVLSTPSFTFFISATTGARDMAFPNRLTRSSLPQLPQAKRSISLVICNFPPQDGQVRDIIFSIFITLFADTEPFYILYYKRFWGCNK